jgi:hypothetical protein
MLVSLNDASQDHRAHPLDADLIVEELPDRAEFGLSVVVRVFVHDDVNDDIIWKCLDGVEKIPETVSNIVVKVE